MIPLGEILPQRDPQNARQHTEESQRAIEQSLRQLGPSRSILLDAEGIVRAGNGTISAAQAAGIESVLVVPSDGTELVAVRRRDLTPAERQALALADNRTGELSRWGPLLRDVAKNVAGAGFSVESLGFDAKEMEFILRKAEAVPAESEPSSGDRESPEKKSHIEQHVPDQSGKLKSGYQIMVLVDTLAARDELLQWAESEGLDAEPLRV